MRRDFCRHALRAVLSAALFGWATAAVAQQPQPQPPPRRLDLMEFRVEGNTLLPQRDIEAALYPFLGPDRTEEDVEHARAALEDLYGKRGYPTVSAAVDSAMGAQGVVRIVVLQRPVGRLRVVGAQYVAPSAIKAAAPSLAPGKVLHMPDVQADLVALNQLPDRSVTPALKPGGTPDTVDVDLKVDDHLPLAASLDLANRRSPQTTPLRDTASLSYDNLWQRGDSASVGLQIAPLRPSDTNVATASYTYRIPDSRASLTASYIRSDSNVSSGGAGQVVGRGQIAGLRLLDPLDGEEGFSHSVTVGFDYKNLTQDVGQSGSFTHAPIAYVPFTASYAANWSDAGNSTDAAATLIWAWGGLGSNAAAYDAKRLDAKPDFAYLKADFAHTHTLPYGIEVYAHAQMQAAPAPLVSSEQLSLGGMDTVRGYLESESLGDYGGAEQVELRSPPLARFIGGPVTTLRLLGFVDAGAAKIHLPQRDETATNTLASAGVGASVRLFDHVGGEIDDAQVLLHGPVTRNGTNRVLFRLYGEF